MLLSVIIPVYNAQDCIAELLRRCKDALAFTQENYEIVLVDDGSPDNSWAMIAEHSKADNIAGIKLSRNFGQHQAITAGIDYCAGDWVVVMDCDLQDQPEAIESLYNEVKKGFDMALAKRINRKDGVIKKMQSNFFYLFFSFLTGIKFDGSIGNFGIYSRKVIDTVKVNRETTRVFSLMVQWTGFSKSFINVEHGVRQGGKSAYTFNKLFKLAFDIILAYSDKPLKIIVKAGFFISLTSFCAAITTFVRFNNGTVKVPDYTGVIISVWFLGGLIIFILGVVGLYISRIFAAVKNRPIYIIDKIIK